MTEKSSDPGGREPDPTQEPVQRFGSIPPMLKLPLRDRIGEACGLALASCVLGSIPAALRVSRAGGSLLGGLLSASAIVLPLIALTIWLSHQAGRGFRMMTGLRAGRSTAALIALWIGLMSPVLLLLGAILKEKTNHRGLGGTTFGVLALVVAIGAAAVAHRLVGTGRWLVDRGLKPQFVATALALLTIGPLLVVSLPLLFRHDDSPNAHIVAAALIDGVIFAVASAVAVTYDFGDRARNLARKYGIVPAAVVLLTGFGWLSMSPHLAGAMRSGGGLAAAIVAGLERWTDRDGDGYGAHFGGGDCDEGDPRRNPGASDTPGDGIDQDCDGVDGTAVPTKKGSPERAPEAPETPVATPEPAPTTPAPTAPIALKKPSIILVTLDTIRSDYTSLYGFDKKTTPRLDALAERGVVFDVAYAPASDSQRALMPLFSAVSFKDTPRSPREWPLLKTEANTVAERMKAAGYATTGVSSFQWLSQEKGFDQGFDKFEEAFRGDHPEKGVTGPHAIRAARAAVEKATDGKPIFLWVHLFDAHEQYRKHDGFAFGGKSDKAAYLSEIGFVDKQLGDLIDAVDASPIKDSVVWIVHGSQGEGFDEHDAKGHGRELYEEMVRVPLVVTLPGGTAKHISGKAVSTLDIVPTVLELGGAGASSIGTSLLPAMQTGQLTHEPVVLRNSKRASVIDYPMKLIVFERPKQDRFLLFDLSKDPKEEHDISAERAGDVARLKEFVDKQHGREARR